MPIPVFGHIYSKQISLKYRFSLLFVPASEDIWSLSPLHVLLYPLRFTSLHCFCLYTPNISPEENLFGLKPYVEKGVVITIPEIPPH